MADVIHTKLGEGRRVAIPAELCQRYGIEPGDPVVLEPSESGIVMRPLDVVIREVQAFFSDAAPKEVLLSDELVRDRREEANQEDRGASRGQAWFLVFRLASLGPARSFGVVSPSRVPYVGQTVFAGFRQFAASAKVGESEHDNRRTVGQDNRWDFPKASGTRSTGGPFSGPFRVIRRTPLRNRSGPTQPKRLLRRSPHGSQRQAKPHVLHFCRAKAPPEKKPTAATQSELDGRLLS